MLFRLSVPPCGHPIGWRARSSTRTISTGSIDMNILSARCLTKKAFLTCDRCESRVDQREYREGCVVVASVCDRLRLPVNQVRSLCFNSQLGYALARFGAHIAQRPEQSSGENSPETRYNLAVRCDGSCEVGEVCEWRNLGCWSACPRWPASRGVHSSFTGTPCAWLTGRCTRVQERFLRAPVQSESHDRTAPGCLRRVASRSLRRTRTEEAAMRAPTAAVTRSTAWRPRQRAPLQR